MRDLSIGFVGGGRVTAILLGGWSQADRLPRSITVCDPDGGVLARLSAKFPSITAVGADHGRAASQDVVFLALHPPVLLETLPRLSPRLNRSAILVSLAPKLTIGKLASLSGGFSRVARMIPNAASIVGCGYNPVAFGEALTGQDRAQLSGLFRPLGRCPEVAEAKLEAYALITGMGPTYFWPQLYQLRTLAQSFGLSSHEAGEAIHEMLVGALATMEQAGLGPAEVQDLIPVKPMADFLPALLEGYRTKLTAIMEKIRPQ